MAASSSPIFDKSSDSDYESAWKVETRNVNPEIQFVAQGTIKGTDVHSQWCWAACTLMMVKHFQPGSMLTIYDIVKSVYERPLNKGANFDQVQACLSKVGINVRAHDYHDVDKDEIIKEINNNRPFMITFSMPPVQGRTTVHNMLVGGYRSIDGCPFEVRLYDPYLSGPIYVPLDDLHSGTYHPTSEKLEGGKWQLTTLVETVKK